jgi:hypothetical protein
MKPYYPVVRIFGVLLAGFATDHGSAMGLFLSGSGWRAIGV